MHADEKKGKQNVKITVDHQMQSEQGQWEGISKNKITVDHQMQSEQGQWEGISKKKKEKFYWT